MQFKFSEQLRLKCIALVKKKAGVEISHEQADMYLEAFGKIGMLALNVIQDNQSNTQKHEKNSPP